MTALGLISSLGLLPLGSIQVPSMNVDIDNVAVDDDRLVEWLKAVALHRDRSAFAKLYRWYAPRIKAYVRRSGADIAVAEEVAQETLIAVWRKANTFDSRRARPSTWLFTIARNKRIDMFRRERRPEIDPHDPALPRPLQTDVEASYARSETESRMREAIEKLPRAQAEILRLSYYEDKSQRDIAVELGLPLGTVKSRTRLAFGRIKSAFERLQ